MVIREAANLFQFKTGTQLRGTTKIYFVNE